MKGPAVVLIIPALNEEASLPAMFDAIPRDLFHTIVVADNGSTDRTAEIAAARGALVVTEPERGYGAASLKAMAALPPATEVVVWMQADLSEYPEDVPLLAGPIAEGKADMVIGVRDGSEGSLLPHQVFGNWLACYLMRVLLGYRYTDLGPFRAIRLSSLRALAMADRNYGWTIEMQIKACQRGLRVLEVPVRYRKRYAGENKVSGNAVASVRAGWIILKTVFRYWRRAEPK